LKICIDLSEKIKISSLIENLDDIFNENNKDIENFLYANKDKAFILLRKSERLRDKSEIRISLFAFEEYRIDKESYEDYLEFSILLYKEIEKALSLFNSEEKFYLSLEYKEA